MKIEIKMLLNILNICDTFDFVKINETFYLYL